MDIIERYKKFLNTLTKDEIRAFWRLFYTGKIKEATEEALRNNY